ncbi:MAG: ATP-binding cassette domain-containing protein, partial [Pseudomonadota bacterium]
MSHLPGASDFGYASPMSLAVTNLSITRQSRLILRDISFRVGEGSALLLRGPNGVGKTTLLRALAG